MIGRDNSVHIGASGLIYGQKVLSFYPLLSKNKRLMAAGLIRILAWWFNLWSN